MSGCGETTGDAILSVNEIHQGRAGAIETDLGPSYIRAFVVVTGNSLVSAKAVRDADGIPEIGDSYETSSPLEGSVIDLSAVCTNKTASHPDPNNQAVWHVVCQYDRLGKPTDEPNGAAWRTNRYQRPFYKEIDGDEINTTGDPVDNSTGDPYVNPPSVDDDRLVYARSYWIPRGLFSEAELLTYRNSINQSAITIGDTSFPAQTLKIQNLEANRQLLGGDYFWHIQIVLEYRSETWKVRIPDKGYRYLRSGEPVEITDEDGNNVTQEKFLDGAGGILAPGGVIVDNEFDAYQLANFALLNLDHGSD